MTEQALGRTRKLKAERKVKHGDLHMFRCPSDLSDLLDREPNASEAIVNALEAAYARFGTDTRIRCPGCKGVGWLREISARRLAGDMHHFRTETRLTKLLRAEENKSQFIVLALAAWYIAARRLPGQACIVCGSVGSLKKP